MSNGEDVRYFLKFLKDYRHSSDHEKSFLCRKILKKDRYLSTDFKMNRLSTVILLLSYCISFLELRCFILIMIFIFLRLSSISRCDIRNPKNFFKVTPHAHLVRFNLIWSRWSVLKASSKSGLWFEVWVLFTSMSSMYTFIFHPICALKILLASHW